MNNLIRFSQYGSFLSGRSLSKEIIRDAKLNTQIKCVTLDFENITVTNQSFLSQVLCELLELGFTRNDLKFKNVQTPELLKIVERQLDIIFPINTNQEL